LTVDIRPVLIVLADEETRRGPASSDILLGEEAKE